MLSGSPGMIALHNKITKMWNFFKKLIVKKQQILESQGLLLICFFFMRFREIEKMKYSFMSCHSVMNVYTI